MVNINNLFLLMTEKGISAKQLSSETGISTGNISDWKSGRSMPTANKLDTLANYLNVSVDYLLDRKNNTDNFTDINVNHKQQYDETTIQVAEMFSKMNIINKTKILNFMIELSESEKSR